MTRTIQAPGIELREIDKSEYGKEDHSLTSTTVFSCGFASKGPNCVIQWINTIQNFIDTYGVPETDEERYFFNVAAEVITKGGVFLGAKLPYNNQAKNSYACTDFTVESNIEQFANNSTIDNNLKQQLTNLDPTIISYKKITGSNPKYITPDMLEELRISKSTLSANTIRIVDITHSQYNTVNIHHKNAQDDIVYQVDCECLGILPVITTATNALFYQNLLSGETVFHRLEATEESWTDTRSGYEITEGLSAFQPIKNFRLVENNNINYSEDNYSTLLSSYSIYDNTVSKLAMEHFPTISFLNSKFIDRTYLKQIGIVVFKMFKDSSSNETINFQVVESFVGSLNPKDKDNYTKRSLFIDNIVNTYSSYINVFSNVNQNQDDLFDMYFAANNTVTSLGIYKSMSEKIIDYNESIQHPLNMILDHAKDRNLYNIDIVCDAGISNIAQGLVNSNIRLVDSSTTTRWKAIVQKFTTFCSNMRKDCIFLADGLRNFALDHNTKIVRRAVPQNTVENSILPKLKYMTGVNSSYAAGYSVWFQGADAFSGDLIWLPPSIKAAGVYIYTDIYYNKWDAPAGMARGKINNIVDCAFSPSQSEAEKLYMQCWNYAVSYPLDGIIIEGQRTFQQKKTAFDRVNVRRLFLYLEKEVERIAKFFKYEGNTEFLRNRFVDAIRPIFDDAVTRGGIREYYIKCDNDNNTPQTIDNNELHCSIAIKPVKTIEFIILNFICTNQSANVTEVVAE